MYNQKLKVYDEDLMTADLSTTTTGEKVLKAGGTMGAIAVNVHANQTATVAKATTLEILSADHKTDTFESVALVTIPTKTYTNGEMLVSLVVPQNAKRLIKAKLTGDAGNTGNVVATLEYLAR